MEPENPFLEKWRGWLATVGADVQNLHQSRQLFDEVTRLFQRNDAELIRGPFWQWMAGNYAWSIAMGIRPQTDVDEDVVFMARLIEDIANHPDALTRSWFVERWVANATDRLAAERAHAIFDQHAPDRALHVQVERIRRDREGLRDDARRVRDVVNRRFAHNSLREAPDDVTLGEVNEALNSIGERYRVYARLLTQARSVNLNPPLPADWDRPFVAR
jgi:hypothetical protein